MSDVNCSIELTRQVPVDPTLESHSADSDVLHSNVSGSTAPNTSVVELAAITENSEAASRKRLCTQQESSESDAKYQKLDQFVSTDSKLSVVDSACALTKSVASSFCESDVKNSPDSVPSIVLSAKPDAIDHCMSEAQVVTSENCVDRPQSKPALSVTGQTGNATVSPSQSELVSKAIKTSASVPISVPLAGNSTAQPSITKTNVHDKKPVAVTSQAASNSKCAPSVVPQVKSGNNMLKNSDAQSNMAKGEVDCSTVNKASLPPPPPLEKNSNSAAKMRKRMEEAVDIEARVENKARESAEILNFKSKLFKEGSSDTIKLQAPCNQESNAPGPVMKSNNVGSQNEGDRSISGSSQCSKVGVESSCSLQSSNDDIASKSLDVDYRVINERLLNLSNAPQSFGKKPEVVKKFKPSPKQSLQKAPIPLMSWKPPPSRAKPDASLQDVAKKPKSLMTWMPPTGWKPRADNASDEHEEIESPVMNPDRVSGRPIDQMDKSSGSMDYGKSFSESASSSSAKPLQDVDLRPHIPQGNQQNQSGISGCSFGQSSDNRPHTSGNNQPFQSGSSGDGRPPGFFNANQPNRDGQSFGSVQPSNMGHPMNMQQQQPVGPPSGTPPALPFSQPRSTGPSANYNQPNMSLAQPPPSNGQQMMSQQSMGPPSRPPQIRPFNQQGPGHLANVNAPAQQMGPPGGQRLAHPRPAGPPQGPPPYNQPRPVGPPTSFNAPAQQMPTATPCGPPIVHPQPVAPPNMGPPMVPFNQQRPMGSSANCNPPVNQGQSLTSPSACGPPMTQPQPMGPPTMSSFNQPQQMLPAGPGGPGGPSQPQPVGPPNAPPMAPYNQLRPGVPPGPSFNQPPSVGPPGSGAHSISQPPPVGPSNASQMEPYNQFRPGVPPSNFNNPPTSSYNQPQQMMPPGPGGPPMSQPQPVGPPNAPPMAPYNQLRPGVPPGSSFNPPQSVGPPGSGGPPMSHPQPVGPPNAPQIGPPNAQQMEPYNQFRPGVPPTNFNNPPTYNQPPQMMSPGSGGPPMSQPQSASPSNVVSMAPYNQLRPVACNPPVSSFNQPQQMGPPRSGGPPISQQQSVGPPNAPHMESFNQFRPGAPPGNFNNPPASSNNQPQQMIPPGSGGQPMSQPQPVGPPNVPPGAPYNQLRPGVPSANSSQPVSSFNQAQQMLPPRPIGPPGAQPSGTPQQMLPFNQSVSVGPSATGSQPVSSVTQSQTLPPSSGSVPAVQSQPLGVKFEPQGVSNTEISTGLATNNPQQQMPNSQPQINRPQGPSAGDWRPPNMDANYRPPFDPHHQPQGTGPPPAAWMPPSSNVNYPPPRQPLPVGPPGDPMWRPPSHDPSIPLPPPGMDWRPPNWQPPMFPPAYGPPSADPRWMSPPMWGAPRPPPPWFGGGWMPPPQYPVDPNLYPQPGWPPMGMASWPPAAPFWPSYNQGFEYPPDSSSQADKPLEESAREWAEWSQKYAEWYKEYYGVEMPVGDWSSSHAYAAGGTQQQAESTHLTTPATVESSTSVAVPYKEVRPADLSTSAGIASITLPAVITSSKDVRSAVLSTVADCKTNVIATSVGNTASAAVETKMSAVDDDQGDEHEKIVINNLPSGTKAVDVRALVSAYGKVINCKVGTMKSQKETGKLFALVEMENSAAVDHTLANLHESEYKGQMISVFRMAVNR